MLLYFLGMLGGAVLMNISWILWVRHCVWCEKPYGDCYWCNAQDALEKAVDFEPFQKRR